MPVPAPIVVMMAVGHVPVHRHRVERAVTHPGFRRDGIGETAHRSRRPLEDADLHAVLVVEMDMQGRVRQVVVGVADLGQPPRQFPLMVVVNIGQTGNAMAVRFVHQPFGLKGLT